MFAMKQYIDVVQMVIIRNSWKIRAVPVISQALGGCQCYCISARYLSWSYRQHYQCMFIVDQTVLPNDQSGHVSQCFSREPGITWNLCVWLAHREREREENDRILECAVLLLDESCWSNVATVCRWKKNQLQQPGNDPL